jgi:hypothetical protein
MSANVTGNRVRGVLDRICESRVPKGVIMSAFRNSKFWVFAAGLTLLVLSGAAIPASAQDQQPQQPQQPQQQRLSEQELQQLVAPIALYPDSLLAQILTASTYPLEVVMAARWSKDNPNLKGKDLENAMQQQPWDPSVKGLTTVPQVLTMMNDKLDWTQQVGEAFLTQPDDITKAVQTLRAKAESTGNLKTTKEQRVRRVAAPPPPPGEVVVVPEYIAIEPVEPDVIYVPIYDPVVIFGAGYWPAAYVPFFWYPPWWTVGPVWGFWPAYYVGPALWCQYNWGFGFVQINVVQFNSFNHTHLVSGVAFSKWQHNPLHHQGVPYKNVSLQQKFSNVNTGHNLKQNTNLNLKQNTNLNLKQNPKLNAGNKNKFNANLNTGNKNKLGGTGNTKNLHSNLTTGNKNKTFSGSGNQNRINQNRINQNRINQPKFNQPKFNQPKFNQPKFNNAQNFNRAQTFNRGPVGGGGGGGKTFGGQPPKHR